MDYNYKDYIDIREVYSDDIINTILLSMIGQNVGVVWNYKNNNFTFSLESSQTGFKVSSVVLNDKLWNINSITHKDYSRNFGAYAGRLNNISFQNRKNVEGNIKIWTIIISIDDEHFSIETDYKPLINITAQMYLINKKKLLFN